MACGRRPTYLNKYVMLYSYVCSQPVGSVYYFNFQVQSPDKGNVEKCGIPNRTLTYVVVHNLQPISSSSSHSCSVLGGDSVYTAACSRAATAPTLSTNCYTWPRTVVSSPSCKDKNPLCYGDGGVLAPPSSRRNGH